MQIAFPVAHDAGKGGLEGRQQQMGVVRHHDVREKRKSVFRACLVEVFEANVAFLRCERRNASGQIRGDEEIAARTHDSTEARHGRILM